MPGNSVSRTPLPREDGSDSPAYNDSIVLWRSTIDIRSPEGVAAGTFQVARPWIMSGQPTAADGRCGVLGKSVDRATLARQGLSDRIARHVFSVAARAGGWWPFARRMKELEPNEPM